MACGALKPKDSNVEPAVHAVVLILTGRSQYLDLDINFEL